MAENSKNGIDLILEKQKKRSKRNRDDIKAVVEEIKNTVMTDNDTTSKILAAAVSSMKLDSYFAGNSNSHTSIRGLDIPADQNLNDIPDVSLKVKEGFRLSDVINCLNCLSIGFDETGMILYESDKLLESFKFPTSVVGDFLTKVMYDSDLILDEIFNHNKQEVLCQFKRYRNSHRKKWQHCVLKGRTYTSSLGERMFLGYCMDDAIALEPVNYFHPEGAMIDLRSLSVVSRQGNSVTQLLGHSSSSPYITAYVNGENFDIELDLCSIVRHGKVVSIGEMMCSDGMLLILLTKSYITPNDRNISFTYSYPISKVPPLEWEQESVKTSFLEFANNTKFNNDFEKSTSED